MYREPGALLRLGGAWRRGLAACCIAGCLLPGLGLAQADAVPDDRLKAAFVFNFAVFTEWPTESLASGAPMTLCMFPGNALQPALASLGDKTVNGHKLVFKPLAAPADPRACHILVLGSADRERWERLRKGLAGASILTVADDGGAGNEGAVITLGVENRHIGFAVDLGAARLSRLALSSKLLRLARSVQ